MTARATPSLAAVRLGLVAVVVCLIAPRLLAGVSGGQVDEYQVKAAFLLNFVRFVDWPPTAFESPSSPIVIGIVGEDPFGDEIDRLVEHKTVNGRAVEIRRFHDWKSLGKSHVLFVSGSDRQQAAKVIDVVRRSAVMTVGEVEGFAQAGGICNFTRQGARIGFEINVNAAARAGLTLSSKLLTLARIVREEGG